MNVAEEVERQMEEANAAARVRAVDNLKLKDPEDYRRLVQLDPDHAAALLFISDQGMKRRGRIILFLIGAWFVVGLLGWYRDGQQADAYRLLEQNYIRETGKQPPAVTP